jgi:hypothetical protein
LSTTWRPDLLKVQSSMLTSSTMLRNILNWTPRQNEIIYRPTAHRPPQIKINLAWVWNFLVLYCISYLIF